MYQNILKRQTGIAWWFCLVSLLCLPIWVLAQGSSELVTLTGTVTDEYTGEPISYATVRIIGQDRGAYTNEAGKYSLQARVADTLYIEFNYANYVRRVLSIAKPKPGTTLTGLDVKMSEKEGQVQIISAAKVEQNVDQLSISTVTLTTRQVDIQASTDIQAAVNQTSGVVIYDREVSIRGSSGYTYGAGSRVLTLLDGLPMISPNRSSVGFDLLPTDNIAQIEIVKGASSVLYGTGAMGGIINVITSEPSTKPRTVIRSKIKFFDRPANKAADWDGRSGALSPSIHAFHSRKFQFKQDKGSFDLSAQLDLIRNTGFIREEFSNRVRGLVMTKVNLNVNRRSVDNDGQESKSIRGTLSFGVNFQINVDSGAAVLAWGGYPNRALQAGNGFLSYQYLERYMVDPHLRFVNAKGDQLIYRGRFLYVIDRISTGQTGNSYLNYHEVQYVKTLGKDRNITLIGGANYFGNWVNFASTFGNPFGHQLAAFLQGELKFWKAKRISNLEPVEHRLNISLGARYQFEQVTGKDNFVRANEPERSRITMNQPVFRGGVNLRIDEISKGTFLRASIGQGLRSPSVAERFTNTAAGGLNVAPNPGIKVERGFSAEVGIRQLFQIGKGKRFNVQGVFDVAGFTMQFWDMVEFLAVPDSFRNGVIAFSAQNISRASISGVEASLDLMSKLGPVDLGFSLGVTWIDPINPIGFKTLDGQDFQTVPPSVLQVTNPLGSITSQRFVNSGIVNDQPYTLKYRNEWLARGSLSLGYKGFNLTTNWRYATDITNYDKLFLLITGDGNPGSNGLGEVARYRDGRRRWFQVFDLILAYNIKPANNKSLHTISFHVFNVGNEEYLQIPGRLAEQRSFAMQYKVEF